MALSQETTVFEGAIAQTYKQTDGGIWLPAQVWNLITGTWTPTRVGEGNYCMRKTAAAQTGFAVVPLSLILLARIGTDALSAKGQSRDIRGVEITAMDVVYDIGTTALNSHTYDGSDTVYANNTAPVNDDTIGGTLSGTLATATQAQPYVTRITIGTPFVAGRNAALKPPFMEIAWDAAAGTILSYYGAFVYCNYSLL